MENEDGVQLTCKAAMYDRWTMKIKLQTKNFNDVITDVVEF